MAIKGKGWLTKDDFRQAHVKGDELVVGKHAFCAFPAGAPDGGIAAHDKAPLDLPPDYRPVSQKDGDFDVLQTELIARYGWSTTCLAVRKKREDKQGYSTFYTRNMCFGAGAVHNEDASMWVEASTNGLGDAQYAVANSFGGGVRLLLRRQA
jgi:hypothetical protein